MSVYRYINNTDKEVEVEGFIVKSWDQLITSIDIPALAKLVLDGTLDGQKDGMPLDYVAPEEATPTPDEHIELHDQSVLVQEPVQEPAA